MLSNYSTCSIHDDKRKVQDNDLDFIFSSLRKILKNSLSVYIAIHLFSLSRLCVLYVETLTGVLFWFSDLLGNIFVQFVFHLRPSPDHYYYRVAIPLSSFVS